MIDIYFVNEPYNFSEFIQNRFEYELESVFDKSRDLMLWYPQLRVMNKGDKYACSLDDLVKLNKLDVVDRSFRNIFFMNSDLSVSNFNYLKSADVLNSDRLICIITNQHHEIIEEIQLFYNHMVSDNMTVDEISLLLKLEDKLLRSDIEYLSKLFRLLDGMRSAYNFHIVTNIMHIIDTLRE